jgi:GNAT superfamily N-acetyltransferase
MNGGLSEKMEWKECVRWCHSSEPDEDVEALLQRLSVLQTKSNYTNPILTRMQMDSRFRGAAYVVLYPGALASIGNLKSETSDDEDRDRARLAEMAKELFVEAFEQGAEMIQAISPLLPSQMTSNLASSIANNVGTSFLSTDPARDRVLQASGMTPMAKLVQMESFGFDSVPRLTIPESTKSLGSIEFIPHHAIEQQHWKDVVEKTYVDTLDIPEMNGYRNIESTLEGYASTIEGTPTTWWVVRCGAENVGCMLLTPTGNALCEVTYLGLEPEWRGKGLSRVLMNFVRDWAIEHSVEGLLLAVDIRNTPAVRLYQSCGFHVQQFVQAWLHFKK